jgi:hypothetical protein
MLKAICLGLAVLLGLALAANGVFMLCRLNTGTCWCPA